MAGTGKRDPSARKLRSYLWGLMLLGAVFSAIVLYQLGLPYPDGQPSDIWHNPPGGDFINIWAAPRIAADHVADLFSFPRYMAWLEKLYGGHVYDHNWSYPLHMLPFAKPFSLLPYLPALLLWTIASLAAFIAVLRRAVPRKSRRLVASAALLAPVTVANVAMGQNGLFIAAASLAVLMLLERKREWPAGILLGCLTIKPHLFLLWPLMLLAGGHWRAILAAVLTTAALLALSAGLYGIEAWQIYLDHVPPMQWVLLTSIRGAGADLIPIYQLMMPGWMAPMLLAGAPFSTLLSVQFAISLSVAAATFWACRRRLFLPVMALLLGSGGMLVTPYAFNYDMGLLTMALLLYWVTVSAPTSMVARWRDGLGFLLPMLVYKFNNEGMPLAPFILAALFLHALQLARIAPRRRY